MLTRSFGGAALLAAGAVLANPTGPTVVSGSATISGAGGTLTITNSSGAIINWQTFNVAAGETTRFTQPAASSTVLNRVTGAGGSDIRGALASNGRVFLVNPNGVLFGAGAQVNVAGLVASTLNISNTDFLAGNYRFSGGNSAAEIRNEGAITAAAGSHVVFLAPNIYGSGSISVPGGTIAFGLGAAAEVSFNGNAITDLKVTQPSSGSATLEIDDLSAALVWVESGWQLASDLLQACLNTVGGCGGSFVNGTTITVAPNEVTITQADGTTRKILAMPLPDAVASPSASLPDPAALGRGNMLGSAYLQGAALPASAVPHAAAQVTLRLEKREVDF